MTKISKQEVIALARLSNIAVHDEEIPAIAKQLEDVLSYAARVAELAADVPETMHKQINVFREDIVVPTDPEIVLNQAPERVDNYFVVPTIIENAKE